MKNEEFNENEIYHEMYAHLLWSTKNQKPVLSPIADSVYAYLSDLTLSNDCNVVSGVVFSDHVQLIVKFRPDVNLSDLLITLKTATSVWIRSTFPELKDFEWQISDFSFTVDHQDPFVIDTKIKPFADLIGVVLTDNGLEWDLMDVLE